MADYKIALEINEKLYEDYIIFLRSNDVKVFGRYSQIAKYNVKIFEESIRQFIEGGVVHE